MRRIDETPLPAGDCRRVDGSHQETSVPPLASYFGTETTAAGFRSMEGESGESPDDTDRHDDDNTRITCAQVARNPAGSFLLRTKTLWSELTLSEISGSLGDLGTLIPLTIALARARAIFLAPALFFAGIANIVTGYLWDVPMCVQPMKSIAAVAVADSLSQPEVTAAGMWMGLFCIALGVTQLIEWVNVLAPAPVVSGLQIGVGLRLASTGIQMIASLGWVDQADCILLAVLVSLLCMFWLRERAPRETESAESQLDTALWEKLLCVRSSRSQPPVGLYLFLLGCLFAAVELATTDNATGQYDLPLQFFGAPVAVWTLDSISWDEWKFGLLEGAIPQLPLTTLNSVISVCCLAHALYPEKRKGSSTSDAVISRKEVCVSVGLMNLILCPFGGMPNCHGAGGLAGQHRLGARHGASVVFLGSNKVILAVFFGASVLTLLDAVPDAILGVMLAIAGQELATTGFLLLAKQCQNVSQSVNVLRKGTVIAIVTAMVIVGLRKTHYGALSGWTTHMIYGDGLTDLIYWTRRRGEHRRRGRQESEQETTTSCPAETTSVSELEGDTDSSGSQGV